jgi:hypothetical protein
MTKTIPSIDMQAEMSRKFAEAGLFITYTGETVDAIEHCPGSFNDR